MYERELLYHLDRVARRLRAAYWWRRISLYWGALALMLGAYAYFGEPTATELSVTMGIVGAAAVALAVITWASATRYARDPRWVAQRIERRFPDLNARLLAAAQQKPEGGATHLGYLQETVVRQALSHRRSHDWQLLAPPGRTMLTRLAALAAAGVLAALFLGAWRGEARPTATGTSEVDPRVVADGDVTIEPGDTEIERGAPLLVLARFVKSPPADVFVEFDHKDAPADRLMMRKSLEDPVFAGRLRSVEQELHYRVVYRGVRTRDYHVTVFDYPALERMDALLEFPEYLSRPTKVIEDTRRVTAIEGSRLTLTCHLNKAVAEARLVDGDDVLELAPAGGDPRQYAASFTLTDSRRYKLELVDDDGRRNQSPAELVVRVLSNGAPQIELERPKGDVAVSPLEELDVVAKISDDVRVTGSGVTYTLGDAPEREVELGASEGREEVTVSHLVAMESLDAQPDQLLTYYFWAEDVDSAGQTRRTLGDIYFAELRPFEEVFRETDPPAGGQEQQQQDQQQQGQQQGGAAQQAQELAELQKQIIAATWKLVRRSNTARDEGLASDVSTVLESQATAVEMATGMSERVTDAQSTQHLNDALVAMGEAITTLETAEADPGVTPLRAAVPHERDAYEALLKLRAREHNVYQSQQQSQQASQAGRQAGQPSQRQLDQLELRNDPRQYETETTAQELPQNDPQAREERQVLNRLRELAERQQDLNEQLKQLQSQLQEAESEDEREELQRRLKRLREEQEEILRDTEELQQRVDENVNDQEMNQVAEQLENTREQIRQTTDSLREGQVTRATAEGTRAERQLQDLRDEFRRRTAGEFVEEVDQLETAAQELERDQDELGEDLDQLNSDEAQSLREDEDVAERLGDQGERLGELLDSMQELVEAAEETEPLLASELYDAFRDVRQQRVEELLESSAELVRLGFPRDAQTYEQRAREEIEELAERIGQAAETVLGDEEQALRRAQETLEGLTEDIDREARTQDPQEEQQGRQPDGEQQQREGSQLDQSQQRGGQQAQGEPQEGRQTSEAPQGGQQQRRQPGDQPQNRQQSERGQQQGGRQEGQRQRQQQQGQLQEGQQQQAGQGQGGQGDGQTDDEQQQQRGAQPGQGGAARDQVQQAARGGGRGARLDLERLFGGGGPEDAPRVLTGDDYRDWSDRLRDVEEMVRDADLRAEAAGIRQQAREMRLDYTRNSQTPDWDQVRELIVNPLRELRTKVSQELLLRQSKESLVPIDRDPAPIEYTEEVREYYQRLGTGDEGEGSAGAIK